MENSQNNSNKKNKIIDFVQKVEYKANNALEDSLMDEDAKSEIGNINYNDIVKNSVQAQISKLPWLVAIFLILIVTIFVGISFFKNNPKTLFTQMVDGMFSYLKNNINDNVYSITDGNLNLSYNVLKNNKDSFLSELSHVKWNVDYVKDNSKGLIYMDLKTKYDDSDFVNLNIYGDNESSYVYASDLYDKYIKLKDSKINYSVDDRDIKIILDGFNQAFDKAITNEKIYSNKQMINVNKKNIKAIKIRLLIDKKNRNRICETFINSLKANDEFINSFTKIYNIKKSEAKKSLDKYLLKLEKYLLEYDKLNVVFYINSKTNEFVKFALEDEKDILSLIYYGNDKLSYVYDNGNKIEGEISFNINENKTKYILDITRRESNNNNVILEDNLNLKFTCKQSNFFKKVDVSNSIDQSELSDLDKEQIYLNILNNPKLNKLSEKLAKS